MAVFQKAKDFQATDLTLPQARTAILEAVDIAGVGLDEGVLSSPSPRETTVPSENEMLEVKENKVRYAREAVLDKDNNPLDIKRNQCSPRHHIAARTYPFHLLHY